MCIRDSYQRYKSRRRCRCIRKTVGDYGLVSCGVYLFSAGIIEVCEPQLKQYRYYQDCQRGGAVSSGVGRLDFFNRAFQKLTAHQKDEEGHYLRGYVFYSAAVSYTHLSRNCREPT